MKTLLRFFDDIHRIANFVTANPTQDMLVRLSQDDRDLLANFRRRKPSVKKSQYTQIDSVGE